jgi:putative DNA primase/helicase
MSSEKAVVVFPAEISDEEKARRVINEAARLSCLSALERNWQVKRSAERLGIASTELKTLMDAAVKEKEKQEAKIKAEERRQEQCVEKQRVREEQQKAVAERKEAQKRERDQKQIEKDAERKAKEKTKASAILIKLPSDQRKFDELAKRFDEDPASLRTEFDEFAETERSTMPSAEWYVEPWPEPVTAAELLQELIVKISRHAVVRFYEVLVTSLWIMMAWVHEVAARYSVFLTAISVEEDSGKTNLLTTCSFLVPKPFAAVEATAASIYRFVDREKPTLIIDEADDLFKRKADIRHILNNAWTRGGAKIPRQVQLGSNSGTMWFDCFCPKMLGILGKNLPRTLATRSILIKPRPLRPDEKVTAPEDDAEFEILRRKLARWSADYAAALKDAKPLLPANFNNRLAANWRLLLAIGDLAGGDWPRQARQAAERLARSTDKPSYGRQLLAALRTMFADGRKTMKSLAIVAELNLDREGVWCEYYRGGPITQKQVAELLNDYEIRSVNVGPKRARGKGYRCEDFEDAWARYLPPDPFIRSPQRKSRRKK